MEALRIRSLPSDGSKQLARRLKQVVPELACRTCGHRDFALIESPDEGVRTTLRRVQVSDPSELAIQQALVTVICTRCGHLEQFAEAVLKGARPGEYGEDHTSE